MKIEIGKLYELDIQHHILGDYFWFVEIHGEHTLEGSINFTSCDSQKPIVMLLQKIQNSRFDYIYEILFVNRKFLVRRTALLPPCSIKDSETEGK
jgi:hypothetical protein